MRTVVLLLFLVGYVYSQCIATTLPPVVTRVSSLGSISSLVVPAGETYIYDLGIDSNLVFNAINVKGTLMFEDEKDLKLDSYDIQVFGGGKFIVGSCRCPFQHKLTMTLHGTDTQGGKSLTANTGAVIQIIGVVFGPSWTVLGASAAAGDNTITLSEPVSWRVGDKIVIASSDYDQDQTEDRVVTAVSGNKVTLDSALIYPHYGENYKGVDMRAEVALLTRQILFTGDNSSETIGAHMQFFSNSRVAIAGVEVTRAGQYGTLGRYPVHFHIAGNMKHQAYVVDTAIHHCFQRCVTLHAAQGTEFRRNVCYSTVGHGYFLEVATESNNIFAYNLGLGIKRSPDNPSFPLPSDSQPAVFWITNPVNTFVHNHAVGGTFGFWYALPHWDLIDPTPNPNMNLKDIIPRWAPVELFSHNTAHGADGDCFHLDSPPNPENNQVIQLDTTKIVVNGVDLGTIGQNYDPRSDPYISALKDPEREKLNVPVWAAFNHSTFYKCGDHGAWLRTMRTIFDGVYTSDCKRGITSATGETTIVRNAVFVGFSPNKLLEGRAAPWSRQWTSDGWAPSNWAPRGFEFYDGPNNVDNARFYDFVSDQGFASATGVLDHDVFSIGWGDDANLEKGNWIRNAVVDDPNTVLFAYPWATNVSLEDGEKQFFGWDMDGYFTGRPPVDGVKATLINNEEFFQSDKCVPQDARARSLICPSTFVAMALSTNGQINDWTTPGWLRIVRADDTTKDMWFCGMGTSCKDTKNSKSQKSDIYMTIHSRMEQYILTEYNNPTSFSGYFRAQEVQETPVFALCLPKGAAITTFSGYLQADNFTHFRTQPWSSDWNKFGMYFLDSSSGFLWVRAFLRTSWLPYDIQFTSSGGKGNWCSLPSAPPDGKVTVDGRSLPPVARPDNTLLPALPDPALTAYDREEGGPLCSYNVEISGSTVTWTDMKLDTEKEVNDFIKSITGDNVMFTVSVIPQTNSAQVSVTITDTQNGTKTPEELASSIAAILSPPDYVPPPQVPASSNSGGIVAAVIIVIIVVIVVAACVYLFAVKKYDLATAVAKVDPRQWMKVGSESL